MKGIMRGIILLLILLLGSCASVKNTLRPVYVTNTKKINLLPPEQLAQEYEGMQMFSGSFGDRTFSLLSYSQIDENGIYLTLMNDFGTDMGSLSYDGVSVCIDSPFFSKDMPGEYIIAEMQNLYYDVSALKALYKASNLLYIVNKDGSRSIYDGKKIIEEIQITDKTVKVTNYLRGYSFAITNE